MDLTIGRVGLCMGQGNPRWMSRSGGAGERLNGDHEREREREREREQAAETKIATGRSTLVLGDSRHYRPPEVATAHLEHRNKGVPTSLEV